MVRIFVAFFLGFAARHLLYDICIYSTVSDKSVNVQKLESLRATHRFKATARDTLLAPFAATKTPKTIAATITTTKATSVDTAGTYAIATSPKVAKVQLKTNILSTTTTTTTNISFYQLKYHIEKAIVVRETHHDELSLSNSHRLVKYAKGPLLRGKVIHHIFHMLLEHTHNVFVHCNTEYVLYAGTLMGAYRLHGIIPWDIDVDVMINSESLTQLVGCLEKIKEHEQVHWIVRHGLHSDIIPIKVVDINSGYYLDIVMCHQVGNVCVDKLLSKQYLMSDLFPSRRCQFDHLIVECPNNPKRILAGAYNGNFNVPVKFKLQAKNLFTGALWAD